MGAILQISRHSVLMAFAALVAFAMVRAGATASPVADASCLAGAVDARAVGADDARSIALEDGRTLRLAGVESFALLLAEGGEAEAALQRRLHALVAEREIRVRPVAKAADRHGRLPALIASAEGPLVQEILAAEGLAVAFTGGDIVTCFDRILAAESQARESSQGFWATVAVLPAQAEAVSPRTGRFAIFEGRVISVGARPARTYLNFGLRWSEDVTVEIESRYLESLGGEAKIADWAGRRVRVRGFVEDKAGPMVTVKSPMQIEVLGEPAGLDLDGGTP